MTDAEIDVLAHAGRHRCGRANEAVIDRAVQRWEACVGKVRGDSLVHRSAARIGQRNDRLNDLPRLALGRRDQDLRFER